MLLPLDVEQKALPNETAKRRLWFAPLAVHWYMQWHMMSWHRVVESVRKGEGIRRCPRLVQGMKR